MGCFASPSPDGRHLGILDTKQSANMDDGKFLTRFNSAPHAGLRIEAQLSLESSLGPHRRPGLNQESQ
jgi:hypothetical protein